MQRQQLFLDALQGSTHAGSGRAQAHARKPLLTHCFPAACTDGTALAVSWLAFVKKYGVAPTAPGQWGTFLAFYAGEWGNRCQAAGISMHCVIGCGTIMRSHPQRLQDCTSMACPAA